MKLRDSFRHTRVFVMRNSIEIFLIDAIRSKTTEEIGEMNKAQQQFS